MRNPLKKLSRAFGPNFKGEGITLLSPTNRGISSIHEPRNKSDNTDKNGDMHLHTKEVTF